MTTRIKAQEMAQAIRDWRAPERFNRLPSPRDETTRLLTKRVAAGIDGVIEGGLPPAYDIAKVACKQFLDGVRVYSYGGEDFLELHPLKIDHEMTDGRIMLNATFNYRYLK
jgi:hypothetical protein